VREALSLFIPCFGVADTNALCHFVSMPLPGNDESMDAMVFYNDSISNYILFKKLILLISWFFKLRSPNRLISFKE